MKVLVLTVAILVKDATGTFPVAVDVQALPPGTTEQQCGMMAGQVNGQKTSYLQYINQTSNKLGLVGTAVDVNANCQYIKTSMLQPEVAEGVLKDITR